MSQAFYFTDPEGNGIELYWDRARTDWSWMHGQIEMATLYLDPNTFLGEHLTEEAALGSTAGDAASVGHVHLSVGDVATARAFYVDALGSMRPPASATRRSSSAPAATTTTWR